jgi:hypothetical protein
MDKESRGISKLPYLKAVQEPRWSSKLIMSFVNRDVQIDVEEFVD